ncbi:thiol reductant ABC exporter subunit CydC [Actinokineospora auranticolor]|uniref:thiol reductant ABC exporter subunit CydC n=1 Tax=Actinokineospora auranticolor TaxID=155976 RepID=UPI0015E2A6E8|nr:thiol reductant ABC exporter subunit CydC [Actinokineospora auranticolor]
MAAVVRLVVAALAGVACEAAGVGLTGAAVWLVCRAARQPPLSALVVAVVLVRGLAVGRGGFRYAERILGHDAVLRTMATIRGRFFDALIPRAGGEYRRGDLLGRLVSDVECVQDLLLRVALPTVAAISVGGIAVAWLATLAPAAALTLAAGLLITTLLLPTAAALSAHRADAPLAAARADLTARAIDLVEGMEDLLVHGSEALAAQREQTAATAVARLERRRAATRAALACGAVLTQLATCAVVAWQTHAASAVVLLGSLAVMEVTLPLRLGGERLGSALNALTRVRAILRTPTRPAPPTTAPKPPVSLRFRGVGYTHPGADRPALVDIDLEVPAGTRVAIVGPSGSGKSTLLALALGLTHPDHGHVELGGANITAPLRPRLVSGLPQDPAVFAGTVRANLELGNHQADTPDLWHALTRVGAHDWVRDLPNGLDTPITDSTISGGERQRLALATALLATPDLLVLDEPVESLDPTTADAVLTDTLNATRHHTTLLVSHRLRGLEQVDRIVVLQAGRIAQSGTHHDLLATPGHYRDHYLAELDPHDSRPLT